MSTWMILRSSAPLSDAGSGNRQSSRLSKVYQETPGEREKGQGKVWERVEQAVTMLADHRRKAVDCKDVVGGKV
jgi:hypothetical protein